jgi:hypothetical protein
MKLPIIELGLAAVIALALSSPCQNAQFRQWPNFDELDRRFVSG